MDKILYLRNVDTTWTRRDCDILSKHFDVDDIYVDSRATAITTSNPFKLMQYTKIFCWFGSLNFLPTLVMGKILGREIIVVAGGFDVAKVPSINYGGFHRSFVSMLLRKLIFKIANQVITVSKYNSQEAINNAGVDESKINMLYHGFQPLVKEITPFNNRKNQIITVGAINPETMYRKGHHRFLKLVKSLPEYQFILAGKYANECKSYIESLKLPNLKVVGFLKDEDLINLFSESKFYVQLSEHEAFGCSVIEAGICGCNLIVSDKAALPEVVKDNGYHCKPDNIDTIKSYIVKNIDSPEYSPELISKNLLQKFSFNKRKEDLIKILNR